MSGIRGDVPGEVERLEPKIRAHPRHAKPAFRLVVVFISLHCRLVEGLDIGVLEKKVLEPAAPILAKLHLNQCSCFFHLIQQATQGQFLSNT